MFRESTGQIGLFGELSRRGYWIGIGVVTLGLIGLTWWMGGYAVRVAEEHAESRVTTGDPLTEILYSPIGNVVVMATLQFLAANVLLMLGLWGWRRVRLITKRPAESN